MIQLGDFRLHLINDSRTLVDAGGAFGLVPRLLWSGVFMPPTEDNLVPMMQHNLLVQAHGRNLLIDTSYGDKMTGKQNANFHRESFNGGTLSALARLGLTPNDIDLVIDTHLHGDHCGGNTTYAADGSLIPVFPNAEYVVQRREYEDASRPNERTRATYSAANFQPLVETGQMRLLDGDTELLPGIRGMVTPGHTPGHMSVTLESGGQHAAFICDLASYAVHFERLGWMTAYDVEPLVTLETKRRWQAWALETNALLIFPHDPLRPMGHLIENADGKRLVVKVDEEYV
ncbi:MAG: MBL fold metallo-hydrolase [Chloroflexota bacterium]